MLATVCRALTRDNFVTQRRHASSDFLMDIVAGEHVKNRVDGAVESRQSQRDFVGRVDVLFKVTLLLQLGEVEGDGAQEQDNVVRSETDQKQRHNRHSQVAHLFFLTGLEACAGLHVCKNSPVGEDQDGQGDTKAYAKPSVVECRNHLCALAWLETAVTPLGSFPFAHDEDGRMNQAHYHVDRKRYESCNPFLAKAARFNCIDHRHIAVDGHAAEQEDADVHVVKEHKASHFAGHRAPGPLMVSTDVHCPQRQREEVSEIAQGQAEQVDAEDVLTTHLVEGEVDCDQVGWQADDKNHNVEHHQRNTVLLI